MRPMGDVTQLRGKGEALRAIFRDALATFCEDAVGNILHGVTERNLCQRLAIPLEHVARNNGFASYRADVEYNRNNDGHLKTAVSPERNEVVTITCDLILHSRGERVQDNLIAIEMKRSTHRASHMAKDRYRLVALTRRPFEDVWPEPLLDEAKGVQIDIRHVCDYEVGYLVVLHAAKRIFSIEEYAGGEMVGSYAHSFAEEAERYLSSTATRVPTGPRRSR